MGVFAFQKETVFTLDGRTYKLLRKVEPDIWQAEELRTGRIHEFSDEGLRDLYAKGKLKASIAGTSPQSSSRKPPINVSPEEWERAKVRRAYVHAILDLPNTRAVIMPVIRETWLKLLKPPKRPSASSVIRWKENYLRAGKDIHALIERHHQKGNTKSRYPQEVERLTLQAIETVYLTEERKPLEAALDEAKALVDKENELRPKGMQLPRPTRRLLKRLVDTIPAFERYAARYGRDAAINRFRAVLRRRFKGLPLEVAEIDHTPCDVLVLDDRTFLPLGRPWLTVCLDVGTRCVLGIYISFEPPSYFTVARCLKHAILPKNIQAEYPQIQNKWEAHGVMSTLLVDNGREFHSQSLENAAYSLGIELQYAPRKKPWFKPHVERFLGTCNREVAHGLPGTTFSNILEKDEYDPVKQAVLRFSAFREILFTWVCDVYHQRSHRGLGKLSPAQVWKESITPDQILLPDDPARLDAILGRSERRRLSHKGIELDGLFYNSPELLKLRRRLGSTLDVEVRVDDADLGRIIVLAPDTGEPITVESLDKDYAQGLSRYQHKVCKRYAAREFNCSGPEAWLRAKARIAQIIESEYSLKKRTTRKRVARYLGESALPSQSSSTTGPAVTAALQAPPESGAPAQSAEARLIEERPLIADTTSTPARVFKPSYRVRNSQRFTDGSEE
nr:MAG: integrase [Pseudomonadota bacterium]